VDPHRLATHMPHNNPLPHTTTAEALLRLTNTCAVVVPLMCDQHGTFDVLRTRQVRLVLPPAPPPSSVHHHYTLFIACMLQNVSTAANEVLSAKQHIKSGTRPCLHTLAC
jgi:hypothetical protein